jgi:ABC-type uncharacterized transport system fused permease/ATPase subunit
MGADRQLDRSRRCPDTFADMSWNKDFFDAVEHKNWPAFFHQMVIFAAIVGISMATMALHLTVKRRLQYSWRR